jgi:hypothetical protein
MSDPSPRPLKEIYLAASEIPDAEERARFLDTACAGDASLRANVEAVLGADAPDDFLDTPPFPVNLTETIPVSGDAVGYFGDYVLLGEIARGSTGVVFRARQVSLNRVVAVKILRDAALLSSPAEERRFRAEAEAAAGLDHPGIVPIYEVGRHEGRGYFSMKLIEGGTLQFHSGEFREPRNAAALMAKVARAVHHAHQKGILHRDLKPGNILLDRNGEPLVADFGTARQLGVESGLTYTGQIIGTPHYMAPEQARGENRGLTPASDIYSLGAILYELLAGRRAFDGETMLTLLKQVTEQPPPPLCLADRDLENIIMRCMEKAPAARYGSAAALADDLERWLRGEPVHARPVGLPTRIAKWARRRPAHAALVAVSAVAAVAVPVALRFVEPAVVPPIVVSNTNDAGPGSLRQALGDAAAAPGPDTIHFAPALSGQSLQLATHSGAGTDKSALVIADPGGVTVDATALPGGLTITDTGNTDYRLVETGSASVVTFRGLTFKDGGGSAHMGSGAAIRSRARASVTIERCTFTGNHCAGGGAIFNEPDAGPMTLRHCTFSGNAATAEGGAIFNHSSNMSLTHCTVSGNTAGADSSTSGGILNHLGTLTLTNCIVAGNTGGDVQNHSETLTLAGANIIPALSNNAIVNGPAPITAAPLLSPLGNHGGATQTMPPQRGSPAVNAATVLSPPITGDQRGLAILDTPDIGAAERQPFNTVVTSAADKGAGSLRQVLAYATLDAGADTITFDPSLSGKTIQLISNTGNGNDKSALVIADDRDGLTMDASSLPGGLTISDGGGATHRLLKITGSNVTLRGLTFKDGGCHTFGNSSGGAIHSAHSEVTIERCTFTGNRSDGGGAIFNAGPMTLRHCTFTGNTTISKGPNTGDGGAIFNEVGPMILIHCTVAGNSASTGQPGTGGIISYLGTLTLENCIVAGNTASGLPGDVRAHRGTVVSAGANIVPAFTDSEGAFKGTALLTSAPLLSTLGNHGGTTQTMFPQPGSPALDASGVTIVPGIITDQRGAPLPDSGRDIGAVEAGATVPGP